MEGMKTMSDLIDREQAISAAKAIFDSNSEMKAFCMMKMLEELPAAQTEKIGKWTKKFMQLGDQAVYQYVCSECGGCTPKDMFGSEVLSGWCPWCGAAMKTD